MPVHPDEFFKRKVLVLARFRVHICNLTTWEVEEEESWIQSPSLVRGQPRVVRHSLKTKLVWDAGYIQPY